MSFFFSNIMNKIRAIKSAVSAKTETAKVVNGQNLNIDKQKKYDTA